MRNAELLLQGLKMSLLNLLRSAHNSIDLYKCIGIRAAGMRITYASGEANTEERSETYL